MTDRLQAEIDKQAEIYGVDPADIIGPCRSRAASAARRAVWSALLTRYARGDFPAPVLAAAFNRNAQIIYDGVRMHEQRLTRWPSQAAPSTPAGIERAMKSLRKRYAAMNPRDPRRKAVRAECTRLREMLK